MPLTLVFCASTAYGAATVIWGETAILITAIDADWVWNQAGGPYVASKEGIKCDYIIFVPGATDDKIKITEESATGAEIFAKMGGNGLAVFQSSISQIGPDQKRGLCGCL